MLPVSFTHTFPAPVWRLLFEQIADAPGRLLVEWRDGAVRRLGVSVLSLPDGQVISPDASELPWSAAVMGVWNGLALFHRLDNERLPVPTALGCFDPDTGVSRWEWPGHMLLACDGQSVEARQTTSTEGSSTTVLFDLQSGRPLASNVLVRSSADTHLHFPTIYEESSQYWSIVTRFVKKMVNQEPFGRLNYAEFADKIIFSYYVYGEKESKQAFLLVTDRQQQIWLHESLTMTDESAQGIDPTAFCVWQNQLLVLSHPTKLIGYYLTIAP